MVTLKQYNGSTVQPTDDAVLYNALLAESGVVQGANCTIIGASQIQISSGRIMVCGRMVTVDNELVDANISPSGSQPGRLILRVDMANTETPAYFTTQVGSPLPALVQEDINDDGLIYEFEMATYTAGGLAISDLVNTAHNIPMHVDKVIEKGTSGNWTYRKWESGIAECWGSFSQTVLVTGVWDSGNVMKFGLGQAVSFPFPFASVPNCTMSLLNYPNFFLLSHQGEVTRTQTFTPAIVSVNRYESVECLFGFYVIGKV